MIIGSNLVYLNNLPSTNSHAAWLQKEENLQEGTIIYTNFQSAGKGQHGNKWESEDGKNLIISIILYPSMVSPIDQFQISMTISLGICDFLRRYITSCAIKWPNDIYVGNDKIAGILIENSILGNQIEYSIAGIGLNINQKKFISDAPNPVSLSMITGDVYDLNKSLSELASYIDRRYKQLIAGDYEQIREDYISQLYRLNEWSNYSDKNGIYRGRILSITDTGRLKIIKMDGKISEYSFKELDFIF